MPRNCEILKSKKKFIPILLATIIQKIIFFLFLYFRKNATAYREALRRLREKQQETVNSVDAAVVNTTETVSDKNDSTETKPQAKPKRRPSQSLLIKPKVPK